VLRNLALINCDCDNVFDDEFVVGSLETLMASRHGRAASVRANPPLCPAAYASGDQACLTGRVAYWASDFIRIGGYDEEPGVVGSGYQDRDICLRLQKATGNSGAKRGLPLTKSVGLGVNNRIGATTKEDRGPVKVENCNPNDLDLQKTWSSFNAHNTKRMVAKTARGQLVRNLTGSFGGGAPNLTASLRDLCHACAASTGAFWVVTEANRSQQDAIVICLGFQPATGLTFTCSRQRSSSQRQPASGHKFDDNCRRSGRWRQGSRSCAPAAVLQARAMPSPVLLLPPLRPPLRRQPPGCPGAPWGVSWWPLGSLPSRGCPGQPLASPPPARCTATRA